MTKDILKVLLVWVTHLLGLSVLFILLSFCVGLLNGLNFSYNNAVYVLFGYIAANISRKLYD